MTRTSWVRRLPAGRHLVEGTYLLTIYTHRDHGWRVQVWWPIGPDGRVAPDASPCSVEGDRDALRLRVGHADGGTTWDTRPANPRWGRVEDAAAAYVELVAGDEWLPPADRPEVGWIADERAAGAISGAAAMATRLPLAVGTAANAARAARAREEMAR
jgi:hypothetical protein